MAGYLCATTAGVFKRKWHLLFEALKNFVMGFRLRNGPASRICYVSRGYRGGLVARKWRYWQGSMVNHSSI
ncbi:hypothetical protein BCEP27_160034 [Burkholderia cepacia]